MDDPFSNYHPAFTWERDSDGDYRPKCPDCGIYLQVICVTEMVFETEYSGYSEIGFGSFSSTLTSPQEMLDSGNCRFYCFQCTKNYSPPTGLTRAEWQ